MSADQGDAGQTAHADEFESTGTTVGTDDELARLTKRILQRDGRATAAKHDWYRTGQDLVAAKEVAGHGAFDRWCKTTLSYSKRKAERLMKAYETAEPHVKNDNLSVLPPLALVNKLANAPYLGEEAIADCFTQAVIQGKAAAREAMQAIRRHQDDVRRQRVVDLRRGDQAEGGKADPRLEATNGFATFLAKTLGDRLGAVLDRLKACKAKIFDEGLVECLTQISDEAADTAVNAAATPAPAHPTGEGDEVPGLLDAPTLAPPTVPEADGYNGEQPASPGEERPLLLPGIKPISRRPGTLTLTPVR